MSRIPRFLLIPLAATVGALVPSVAGADIPPGACDAVFAAEPDVRLVLITDPPARGEARPNQTVTATIGWEPANWDSLQSMLVCVRIVDTFHPEMSASEDVPLNDGGGGHAFVVPEGLPRGTFICTQAHLSGDPAGEATEASLVSKKSCLEVHPDAQETPPANNPSPSPTPPPAAAPAPPPPAPAPVPQPSPPSEGAGSVNPPDHVPVAAPGTVSQSPEPPIVERPAGAPVRPGGPIHLDELPRTGAPLGYLAVAGFGALAFGLPAVAVGRRRFRR